MDKQLTDKKVLLSKKQRKVVEDLQNGYVLITSADYPGATVGHSQRPDYHINNRVFWNLVEKGMIYQSLSWPFDYRLTKEGQEYTSNQPQKAS